MTDRPFELLHAIAGPARDRKAHCISDWGHDFRPDYRRLVRVLELLPSGVPVPCTTATANDRVIENIQAQLGAELVTQRGPLARESLAPTRAVIAAAAEDCAAHVAAVGATSSR